MSRRFNFISTGVLPLMAGCHVASVPDIDPSEDSVSCGNQIVSIAFAARLWAWDADGRLPSDLRSLSNEISSPNFLICPGDHARKAAPSWSLFTPADSSYEVVTPGLTDGDTKGVFLRCEVHGHLGYADATVFDGIKRRRKIP